MVFGDLDESVDAPAITSASRAMSLASSLLVASMTTDSMVVTDDRSDEKVELGVVGIFSTGCASKDISFASASSIVTTDALSSIASVFQAKGAYRKR